MKCEKCGKDNLAENSFCTGCGCPLKDTVSDEKDYSALILLIGNLLLMIPLCMAVWLVLRMILGTFGLVFGADVGDEIISDAGTAGIIALFTIALATAFNIMTGRRLHEKTKEGIEQVYELPAKIQKVLPSLLMFVIPVAIFLVAYFIDKVLTPDAAMNWSVMKVVCYAALQSMMFGYGVLDSVLITRWAKRARR